MIKPRRNSTLNRLIINENTLCFQISHNCEVELRALASGFGLCKILARTTTAPAIKAAIRGEKKHCPKEKNVVALTFRLTEIPKRNLGMPSD
jgi:hypothetical protein